MKMTYISRIQGNMKGYKTIYTTKATSRIIDGSYNSIYKGRSMNFDELREYVVGDDIKDRGVEHYPFKTGFANVENILAGYHRNVTMTNDSDTGDALSFIARNFRRRMIILVVTDTRGILNMSEATVKQLKVLHDILLINVEDAGMNGKNVYDISGDTYIPEFFTRDMKLAKKEERKRQELSSACDDKLKKLGISYLTVRSSDSMDEKIVELLNKHKTESSGK